MNRKNFWLVMIVTILAEILILTTACRAEDWFSYSAKNLDHKAIHFGGSFLLEFGADAVIGDPILALPIGCLPMIKEFDDMAQGEPLSYAIGDWCVDGVGVFLGAVTCGELKASYYKNQVEVTARF